MAVVLRGETNMKNILRIVPLVIGSNSFVFPVLLSAALVAGLLRAAPVDHSRAPAAGGGAVSVSGPSRRPAGVLSREASARQQLLDHRRYLDSTQKANLRSPAAIPPDSFHRFTKIQSSSTIFFQDDMESGVNGWTVVAPSDSAAWRLSTRNPCSWSHSWHAGTENGTYENGARVYDELISPPINLNGAIGTVTLLFDEWYETERDYDFCMVDVTTDSGGTWTHLRGGYGASTSGDGRYWRKSHLDLTPYAGRTINIRFVLDTGDSLFNFFEGWYIDNVAVFDQTAWITGTFFFDQNQNGMYDTGETALAGFLFPSISGPINLAMVSNYDSTFNHPLPLGSYFLAPVDRSFDGWYYPWKATTPETLTVNLNTAGQVVTVNTGYYRPPCIVSGRVFQDRNRNGVYNAGEPAFTQPMIELEEGDWPNQHLVAETHADPSGQFSFQIPVKRWTSLDYTIAQYAVPASWMPTVPDPDDPGDIQTYAVSIGIRDTLFTGINFGSYEKYPGDHGVISGYIFNDLNGNGVQDPGEPMMIHCPMSLGGYADHYPSPTLTDSLGSFSFTGLASGRYLLQLYTMGTPYGWQQSYPAAPYDIQLGADEVRDGMNFGTYKLPVGTVRGHLFYDTNRNGVQDPDEPSMAGSGVTILGPNEFWHVEVITDRNGDYSIDTLAVGVHVLTPEIPCTWRSNPQSPDTFTLDRSQSITRNFGVYALAPGSISGRLYNDLNANGICDPGEPPIEGTAVSLNGGTYGCSGVWNTSTTTNDSGYFRFDGIWGGIYTLRIAMTAGWRQTQPASLQPYTITPADEQNLTGYDFGVTRDSTFNVAFRTFLPESLMMDVRDDKGRLCKPMPDLAGMEETFRLVVPRGGLNGLHVEFNTGSSIADSISATRFPPPQRAGQKYRWEFRLAGNDTFAGGEEVILFARYLKPGPKIFRMTRCWWEEGSLSRSAKGGNVTKLPFPEYINYRFAIPNMVNIFQSLTRMAMIRYGSGLPAQFDLGIGLIPGPYSVDIPYGKYTYVWSSLTDRRGTTHKGRPRCLDKGTSRQVLQYPPQTGNNILFAEQLAFKANILLSDYGITQAGFGSLIFHGDPANPFNGLSVRGIAAKIDTAMSNYIPPPKGSRVGGYCFCDSNFFDMAYRTIRMIDSAFCGPKDTIVSASSPGSTSATVSLKPVRTLADVPFLSVDSAYSPGSAGSAVGRARAEELPKEYALGQNYPNPFNPMTAIQYQVPEQSRVTLKIYNILGQEVMTLVDGVEDAGSRVAEFTAGKFASGVYLYRLEAASVSDPRRTFHQVRKMLLIK